MITNLKEAKAHLSQFVEAAANGEEVVITVRGKARARLCPVLEGESESDRAEWGSRLEEARAKYQLKGKPRDSQELWDDLRGDR
jgi:prevent-host-death family protein